ncbi:hypothetical protein HHO41_13665 [Bacillus sp. DNRA2]|uniref:hypothetical protein n=1 Tax=Bacillus sp. DNRA2 TaxID=2723053 RepID=UPI00145D2CA9|nr:hypothetical protein [Bacillus sp. DNRA2]NMD71347.1 hypothetical protein [Bacillus sp. DNRA2]
MKLYITILLFLFGILTGCQPETVSKESNDHSSQQKNVVHKEKTKVSEAAKEMPLEEKKQVIMTFFQQDLVEANKMEEEALQSITTTSLEAISNQALLTELVDQKIPAYEMAVNHLKGLDPKITELKTIKEKMVLANEIYYGALKLQQKAIEAQDVSLFEKSNEKMNQYLMVLEEYHYLVEELSQKYQLELATS